MSGALEFDTEQWAAAAHTEFQALGLTAEADLFALGDDIAAEMKAAAPVDPHRKAGRHGKSSIDAKRGRDRNGVYTDVGPTRQGFWLGLYEFGTSRQPPRPFMRPAIERVIARWRR